jgi:cysteine synthase
MIAGTSQALREMNPDIRIVVPEPSSSAIISRGVKGNHTVEGICPGFVPPLLAEIQYSEVRTVNESAARKMARRLATEEGILAGTSSGLNLVAAIDLARELGPGHRVVTVACDSEMKYMASGLFG